MMGQVVVFLVLADTLFHYCRRRRHHCDCLETLPVEADVATVAKEAY